MNRKIIIVLFLLTSVIIAEAPASFARPQYLANLTAVYGGGSCGTCHVIPGGGQRNFNGTSGLHNGTYAQRPNRTFGARNGTFGMRSSNRTLPLNAYGTLFENQHDHATDPSEALMAIGQPPAAADAATATKASPGFGFAAALAGLFACVILARRFNK